MERGISAPLPGQLGTRYTRAVLHVEVTPVRNDRELGAFVRVPSLLRREGPWRPAAETWLRALLHRRRNPYYRHAERELLLARKDGRIVGRVVAHIDHLCNRTLTESVGTFGLLDCETHPLVVAELLASAEAWLRARGASLARGPLGPAMRLGAGLLVDGHDQPPTTGLGMTPPELPRLVERAGYRGARDLKAYRLDVGSLPRAPYELADAARRSPGISVRRAERRRSAEEVRRVLAVLNDLPAHGRACAPWREAELQWTVSLLRPVLDPGLVVFAEQDGVVAGLGVALRNLREVLPVGDAPRALLHVSRAAAALRLKRVRSARIALLSVRPSFVRDGPEGILELLLTELLGRLRLHGVRWVEVSLVDPTDGPLTSLLESSGARAYKTYRVFEKSLERRSV